MERPVTVAPDLSILSPAAGIRTSEPDEEPTTPAPLPDLVVMGARIELETGGACGFTSTKLGTTVRLGNVGQADAGPFVVRTNGAEQRFLQGLIAGETAVAWFPAYSSAADTTITVDANSEVSESDEDNNTLSQMLPVPTLPPTCTPRLTATTTPTPTSTAAPSAVASNTPAPTIPPPPAVTVREGQTTILTYPYAAFTSQAWSQTHNMPYAVLDRNAYNASSPVPVESTYRTLVAENEYLKLTILPDLGGRLYEVLFKPTGNAETYRNPVLKPSPWGPPEMGWWLAAGGIEWCLPVEEHGYESAEPWLATIEEDASGVTIKLRDSRAKDRIQVEVAVRLEAEAGCFTIRPRIENPTSTPLAVKFWTNAMLAPGGRNSPSAELRFVMPDAVTAVTVHSRGDETLPSYNERMPWPVVNGRDLSRLGNWNRWLGFFEDPAIGGFVGVYDETYDEGIVRIFSAAVAQGSKVFAHGWNDAIPPSNWTDDGSSYVEIHGGPSSTFDDSVTVPAGGHLQWTETWYPIAGMGGLRFANETAALNLTARGKQVHVSVAVARPWAGEAVLLLNGQEEWRSGLSLLPGQVFGDTISLGIDVPPTGQLTIRLDGQAGNAVATYTAEYSLE